MMSNKKTLVEAGQDLHDAAEAFFWEIVELWRIKQFVNWINDRLVAIYTKLGILK